MQKQSNPFLNTPKDKILITNHFTYRLNALANHTFESIIDKLVNQPFINYIINPNTGDYMAQIGKYRVVVRKGNNNVLTLVTIFEYED